MKFCRPGVDWNPHPNRQRNEVGTSACRHLKKDFHMTTKITTAAAPAATLEIDRSVKREVMSRKQFNGFLYDLFGCQGNNDVTADATYEADDFHVEFFANSPTGPMIAIHHGFVGFNFQTVDLMRLAVAAEASDDGVDFIEDGSKPAAEHEDGFISEEEDTGVGAPPDGSLTDADVMERFGKNVEKWNERLSTHL
jgi:hypothetical protein